MKSYDLVVIGSGPAGEKAAVKAAYFGFSVAIVEKEKHFGGAGIQTGTLPSKTLKETALYLSGVYQKGIFSVDRELGRSVGVRDFMYRKEYVSDELEQAERHNLIKHKVDIFVGNASFIDDHHVRIEGTNTVTVEGKFILIATGSYPFRPKSIPFDGLRVHDSDTILNIQRFPRSICVLGAGVIGCEYATIFASMGAKVYIVNNHPSILGFLDSEISAALVQLMKNKGIEILFKNSTSSIVVPEDEELDIHVSLADGSELHADMFLFAAGRNGNTPGLKCEKAGIVVGDREAIVVNEKYQTSVAHIYAVGDVIGFPALASTGMDQGRIAVAHMFNTGDLATLTEIFPYGIYTVPEVSMVGTTEEEAKRKQLDYEVGYCYYRDIARGKIIGDKDNGFLKIVFLKSSKVVMGVHIIGPIATELIHYGMALVNDKKSLDEVIATVFNYPTLHDLYKYASYDGLGNLAGRKVKIAGELI